MTTTTKTADTSAPELHCYFENRRLISVRANGVVLQKQVGDRQWQPYTRKKPEVLLGDWIAMRRARYEAAPWWARAITKLPSEAELAEAVSDGVCPTVTGDDVEPDGYGPDGAPSWLLALGLI